MIINKFFTNLIIILLALSVCFCTRKDASESKEYIQGKRKLELANSLVEKHPRQAIAIGEEVISLFKNIEQKDLLAEAYKVIGLGYFEIYLYDTAINNLVLGKKLFSSIGDLTSVSFLNNSLGAAHIQNGNYKIGLQHVDSSYIYNFKHEKISDMMRNYFNHGLALDYLGDYTTALDFYHKSLDIAEKVRDTSQIYKCKFNVGVLNSFLGNDDLALDLYNECLKFYKKKNMETVLAKVHQNIGIIYDYSDQNDLGLFFLFKSLTINKKNNLEQAIGDNYNNIAILYEKMNCLKLAKMYFVDALKYKRRSSNKERQSSGLVNLGGFLLSQGDLKKAFPYLNEALDLAENIGSLARLRDVHEELTKPLWIENP